MKKDFDLIRELLLNIEEKSTLDNAYFPNKIEGYSEVEINYHIKMLANGGFLDLTNQSPYSDGTYRIDSITLEGHEFLDNIKNSTVWEKTKKTAWDKTGTLTFEIIKTISTSMLKSMINDK